MMRWGKNPAPPVAAGAGASAAGEVAVQKVDKIEVLSLMSRPSIYGLMRAPRGVSSGAEAHDINKKAEEFIKQRKQWFHRQKPGEPSYT